MRIAKKVCSLYLIGLAVLLALATGSRAALKAQQSPPQKPNVVFVITDDQQESTLAHMGAVRDRLLKPGRRFENTVNTLPFCCPSRATIHTGLYPHNTGVWDNAAPHGGYGVFRDNGGPRKTSAAWLHGAGYRTAYLGRYMHGFTGDAVPPGYDRFNVELQAGPDKGEYVNKDGVASPLPVPEGETQDSVMARRAAKLVGDWTPASAPFFLTVGFQAPHAPAVHEDRYAGLYADQRVPRTPDWNEQDVSDKPAWIRNRPPLQETDTNVQAGDCLERYATAIGQNDCLYRNELRSLKTVNGFVHSLINKLNASGETANTYVLFYTDNGIKLGSHRVPFGKLSPYEPDVSFPLIVRGPGVPAGTASTQLAGNHDIAPTIADIAGVSHPETDGRSLLPAMRGDATTWRSAVYMERRRFDDAPPAKGGPQDVPGWEAVRTEDRLYVEYATGEKELYNLGADPYQLRNLAGRRPEQEAVLAARLDALRDCSGPSCKVAEGP